jgi:hypothetical protein
MVRPLFTRRFWGNDPAGSSGYSSHKPSNGFESHELSRGSVPGTKASRLGFRTVKDPYNVSVLRTQGNESQEEIIAGDQKNGFAQTEPSQISDQSNRRSRQGIVVETEVNVSREEGKQAYPQNWKPV